VHPLERREKSMRNTYGLRMDKKLTDKFDGSGKMQRQVLRPMVRNRNFQIFYFPSLLENIWKIWRDI
jgi:hypothetical protein